ncbi:MAG TPA: cytochrome c [Magnetospirillaceae bacterium]|nr:cytochrome c [Magnetospirillaceae bacterium]
MKRMAICLLLGLLAGCDDMNKQAKTPPDGDKSGQAVVKEPEGLVAATPEVPPPALTQSVLERGQDEFNAFCAPCHSERGDGKGMVVQRGFPQPPSFHTDQARSMAPAEIYQVISDGSGVMYSFSGRIRPVDRWAIVAYVRALQISRNAKLADVPADEREKLR